MERHCSIDVYTESLWKFSHEAFILLSMEKTFTVISREIKRRTNLKYNRKYAAIFSLLFIVNIIGNTACGNAPAEMGHVSIADMGMENTPVINYTIPTMTPNILVDQQGYAANGDKQAVVKSREPVEDFRLINKGTGEIVYDGRVKQPEYNEDLQLYIGTADFTEYAGEGSFYLECDRVGQSLSFSIQERHYEELLETMCEKVHDSCRDCSITEDEILTLLVACEWYPEVFTDDNGNEIPDMLEYIADWLEKTVNETADKEPDTMTYVAVLAKFSYLYQKYDVQYATQCLQHASAIYTKLAAASGRDAEKFMALAELYRAAGLPSYRSQILEYKEFFEDNTSYLEETAYLYGSMTYLATRQSVDIDLCTAFMEGIRDQGEELAKRSGKMINAVTSVNNGTEDLLKRAEELACANYILYSYQYTEILEDFLHYLMGRNRDSVCYYPEEGKLSVYLLLIAQQVSLTGKH